MVIGMSKCLRLMLSLFLMFLLVQFMRSSMASFRKKLNPYFYTKTYLPYSLNFPSMVFDPSPPWILKLVSVCAVVPQRFFIKGGLRNV